jgi:hypothetical protein
MEIPKIATGLKAMGAAAALGGDAEMTAATGLLVAGIGKKIFGGLFKKKQEDTLERKFEKVLDERKHLFERVYDKNLPDISILGKTKLIVKKMKNYLSKFLTAALAALKMILAIIKTALISIAKAMLSLVKWIGKKILKGLLKSIMKLCKTGGFRKMKARIKVFGKKLKGFKGKGPAALLIGGIALGMAGYFSAIFKKEKKEIDQIGGEDDEKDKSVSEETPTKTEEPPTLTIPPEATPPPAVEPSQTAPPRAEGTPVPAAPAAPPRAEGTPVPAAPAAPPRAAGTSVPAAPAVQPRAEGTPVPAAPAVQPRAAGTSVSNSTTKTKPAPMAKGDVSDSNAVELVTSKLGISKEEWSIFKNTVAAIESGGVYDIAGGSGKHYDGRYQLGRDAKIDGAKVAGIANPGHGDVDSSERIKFRKDPALQELLFAGYTIANYNYLKSLPEFKKQSKAGQLQTLGYAHNQGMGGAANWLKTGVVGSDGFGTKGTKYTDALRQNFIAAGFVGSPSSEKLQTASASTSGNALASGGSTQYDKNQNTKTNIVIASKANNKINNIQDKKAA